MLTSVPQVNVAIDNDVASYVRIARQLCYILDPQESTESGEFPGPSEHDPICRLPATRLCFSFPEISLHSSDPYGFGGPSHPSLTYYLVHMAKEGTYANLTVGAGWGIGNEPHNLQTSLGSLTRFYCSDQQLSQAYIGAHMYVGTYVCVAQHTYNPGDHIIFTLLIAIALKCKIRGIHMQALDAGITPCTVSH